MEEQINENKPRLSYQRVKYLKKVLKNPRDHQPKGIDKKAWEIYTKRIELLQKVKIYERLFPNTPLNRLVYKRGREHLVLGIRVERL